jgi:nitronate monooxygenase
MPFRNRVTEILGIEHPVLLAPMDAVAGGGLAGAVSAAGGLGLLGGGYADADFVRTERPLAGNARIGCGFITWALERTPAVLDDALAHRPAAIMLSFGDPRPFAAPIRAAGARLICQVQSLAQAHEAAEAGADIIVAQGTEAGGHGQSAPLNALLPAIADALPAIPIVAAGGIADGRGMAAAMMLGAEGVLMGTRFYASQEAIAPADAKRRIVAAGVGDSVRSVVFDISRGIAWPAGYTGRVLKNRQTERWLGRETEMRERQHDVIRDYAAAKQRGDYDIAAVIAGEGAGLIGDIPPAGEIVRRVVAEAERLLRSPRGLA